MIERIHIDRKSGSISSISLRREPAEKDGLFACAYYTVNHAPEGDKSLLT
jgi:hypothetical protein